MSCKWIDVKVEKPKEDCYCLTINAKHGIDVTCKALYDSQKDIFILRDGQCDFYPICLDVTHYLIIPNPPNKG